MSTTLAKTPPSNFSGRVSAYVPAMRYAADVDLNAPTAFSLGTPPTEDADGILNDKSATDSATSYTSADFVTTFTGKLSNHVYGVNLTATGTSGSDHVITVSGRDYLGQFMKENLTLSGTTKIIGRKAFKWVDSIAVAAGAAGDTFDLGWGLRLGLPYKIGSLVYSREDGTITYPFARLHIVDSGALATLEDPVVLTITSPIKGTFLGITAYITTAISTGAGVLDAVVAGTGATLLDVNLPIEASGGALGGNFGKVVAPSEGFAVNEGDTITYTSDGVPAAGAIDTRAYFAYPQCTVVAPDVTDPATATTDDVRGTYQPFITMDGAKEIIIYGIFENTVNSSGNGGLHGIAQYYA